MINSENGETASILVVDDAWLNRELMEGIFSVHGFQVVTASSADEALKQVVEVTPDVVLIDIRMPEIDGYELCRTMKADQSLKDTPVVLMTALEIEEKTRRAAREAGADDVISRGAPVDDIVATVRLLLPSAAG